ncbi:MAG: hypothetical protein OXT74_17055 [Candidatus Poribacteria bacterium]|nr:hypothetical protein [Candidatus Poribacteria bacterium]
MSKVDIAGLEHGLTVEKLDGLTVLVFETWPIILNHFTNHVVDWTIHEISDSSPCCQFIYIATDLASLQLKYGEVFEVF